MDYFNNEAVFTYLTLTDIAFNHYLISESDYYERLHLLRLFCNPTDKDFHSNIDIYITNFKEQYYIHNTGDFIYEDNEYQKIPEKLEPIKKETQKDSSSFQDNDFDPSLHFITSIGGKISKWEFHKTDSDFFPSIPHGHAIINHQIKLDPYKGYIYKNNQQVDREKREFIIALWNDNNFRNRARETVIYYMKTYPHYRWRVSNPMAFPRRRK